jgi:hypothetical protein
MTTMLCERFQDLLADDLNAALPQEASDHIGACTNCRSLYADLLVIAGVGREWGAEDAEPPARLWAAIESQLEAEGLIARPAAPPAPASHGWLSGWWNFAARLETAGAYVLLLLLAAGIAGYQFAPGSAVALQDRPATAVESWRPVSRPALDGLGRTLDGNMKFAVASLSPDYGDALTISIEKNLQIVDNLIAVCEKKVRENPYDPLAREYLYGAYQQKADLLSVAWDRSALEAQ